MTCSKIPSPSPIPGVYLWLSQNPPGCSDDCLPTWCLPLPPGPAFPPGSCLAHLTPDPHLAPATPPGPCLPHLAPDSPPPSPCLTRLAPATPPGPCLPRLVSIGLSALVSIGLSALAPANPRPRSAVAPGTTHQSPLDPLFHQCLRTRGCLCLRGLHSFIQ